MNRLAAIVVVSLFATLTLQLIATYVAFGWIGIGILTALFAITCVTSYFICQKQKDIADSYVAECTRAYREVRLTDTTTRFH